MAEHVSRRCAAAFGSRNECLDQRAATKRTGRLLLFLCHSLSVRDWRAHIRNALVAAQRPRIWQLGLGGGVDPFQFHGRPGAGKRDRRVIENSAMAAAIIFTPCWRCSSLCLVAQSFLVFRLLGELLRPRVANALELSARASWTAVRCVFPDSADADNGDGPDAAGVDRRSMLRQTNFGRAIGFLYGSNTLGAVAGAVLGEGYLIAALGLRGTSLAAAVASLHRCNVGALFVAEIGGETSESLAANVSAALGCEISAAVAFASRQLWDGLHSSVRWK